MAIRNISLDHPGGRYFYRINDFKLNSLCNGYESLKKYLNRVFENCPDKNFISGPRSSSLKFSIPAKPMRIGGHEISELTRNGLKINKNRYKTNHSKVQVFMLEFDDKTIAVEIPIWMKNNELRNYEEIFNSKRCLSGHIDLLRIENGKIWVWDYKPRAHKEKYADTQVYFYSLMLSKRTGIDLKKFRCGYFDENNSYIFEPKKEFLKLDMNLKEF